MIQLIMGYVHTTSVADSALQSPQKPISPIEQYKKDYDLDLRFNSGFYEQLTALQNSALIVEINANGELLYLNLLMCEFLGICEKDTKNLNLEQLRENFRLNLSRQMFSCLLRGESWKGVVELGAVQQQARYLQMTITPVCESRSWRPYKFVCIGFDVTNQRRQKQNLARMMQLEKKYIQQLEQTKINLEKQVYEQVEEIKDSVNYSKRIQNALMPKEKTLSKSLPAQYELAMIFQPLDVVSGDFYWSGKNAGKTALALGDCTGHGVPGAFMSILGITSLAKWVEERGVTDPAEILTRVDDDLLNTLNQEENVDREEFVQDSIEMSVCMLDDKPGKISIASAMISAFLLDKEDVSEIKGTRRPLGGTLYDRSIPFETQEISMEQGDTLFLTSDGFYTQLGEQNKPMGRKRFRQTLREIRDVTSLKDQMQLLKIFLKEWRGMFSQPNDDVCVIAIKRTA